MDTARVTKRLTDLASINYPADATVQMTFFNNYSLTISNTLVKAICIVGLASAMIHAKDVAIGAWSLTSAIFRRISHWFSKRPEEGTAVIYGATNKMGRAYATRFAEEGLNLILIDYSVDRLARLKQKLVKINEDLEESLVCCTLDRTTQLKDMHDDGGLKEIYRVLKKQKEITYFVNCRSVKKKDIELFHKHKKDHIILMTYYNMTIYAAIMRKVLKIMSENHDGRIICVNTTYGQEQIIKRTHPLFYATTQFAVTLTQTLLHSYKDYGIGFLIVHNNYRNVSSEKKYAELVEKSLNEVGLNTNIYV